MKRTKTLTFRVNDEDLQCLDALCKATGLSRPDLLRMMIRAARRRLPTRIWEWLR
jgi:antitoxin component of RelBE/YafQ-DinJ toxin-antitoxin module